MTQHAITQKCNNCFWNLLNVPPRLGQLVISATASEQEFQNVAFLAVGHSSETELGPYKQMNITSPRVSSSVQGRF